MKRIEPVLIFIWFLSFFLNSIDFEGGYAIFLIATIFVGIFYLVASHRIFNDDIKKPALLSILAGISISSSLITIPFNLHLLNWGWLEILPMINLLFSSFLIIQIIIQGIRKRNYPGNYNSILLRTLTVALLTSFFAYRSTGLSIYRNAIIFFNAGNDPLISNMKLFDFDAKTRQYLADGDCEKAIQTAIKGLEAGKKWLGINSDTLTERDINQLWKIQGAYNNVYRAFKCKAEKLEEEDRSTEALEFYIVADSFLNIIPYEKSEWWRKIRASSKNNIAISYDNLNQVDSAVFYYYEAIKYYIDSVRLQDNNLATYFYNVGYLLGKERYFEESNKSLLKCIEILILDSTNENNFSDIGNTYLRLAYNGLFSKDLNLARNSLKNSSNYLTKETTCTYHLYSSAYNNLVYKFDLALDEAVKALECNASIYDKDHQNIAECFAVLFNTWMSIPNYDSAFVNLKKGMAITQKNYPLYSVRYNDYVKREAIYYFTMGNYRRSKELFNQVLHTYEIELDANDGEIAPVFSYLARLNVELFNFEEAKKQIATCKKIGFNNDFFSNSSSGLIMNDIAYVNYAVYLTDVADSIYNEVLELNFKDGIDSSPVIAETLNGMALIEMGERNYSISDSLFRKAIKMYKNFYPNGSPNLYVVEMNLSELCMITNKYDEANSLINNALSGFKTFHKSDHPTIGDMLCLKAKLLTKQGDDTEANVLFNMALRIYENNFDSDNPKIEHIRNQLVRINGVSF